MSSAAEKRLVLEVVGAPGAPVELPRQGVLTIGSDRIKADLCLEGQGVSDVHCAIGKSKSGGFALKDLGSQFGTLVNGKLVSATRIEPGDVIALGSRRLRVVDPQAAPNDTAALGPLGSPGAGPASAPAARPEAPLRATQMREAQFEPPAVRGYRVDKLLGKGGMGEVWLALQERLERPVALKVLKRELSADQDFVGRFLAEARAAAALNHPNVVVVYDAGEDDGHHYLSMEYMDKGNLESRVAKSGRMPWKEVLAVLIEAAKGLQYAESKGIVHRDIKPANLMQNSAGVTKIADLGLASHLDAEATQSEGRKIFGTPHFVSPEQARGERVDHRSDLYSLGATAYRLLSGRTPFEGASTRDILRGHFTEAPKPLSVLAPDVPAELSRAVHKLLEKKPEDRYPSATALLADLERFGQPVAPAGAPRAAPAKKSSGALALLTIAVLAAAGYWVWNEQRRRDALDRAASEDARRVDEPPPTVGDPEGVIDSPATHAGARPRAEDDAQLKLRELQAEIALRDLPKGLDDSARRDALVKLAGEYAGTTVATKALAEAQELAARAAAAAQVEGRRSEAVAEVLGRLRAAVDAAPPAHVGSRLTALRLVGGQEIFETDPDFAGKRREIFGQVLIAGAEAVRRELEGVLDALERGDLARVESSLAALEPELALPESQVDLAPAAALARADLEELGRTTRAWRAQLTEVRETWRARLRADESRAVSAGFGGPAGFERELASFDFAAARARLAALRERTTTSELAADLASLESDLQRGEQVLALVGSEFARNGWRRKTVADPRKGRGVNRNAVAADASGVSIESDGAVETVPWSAFGLHPRELHQLFHERLTRAWTAEEERAIAALMRLASVAAALDGASEMMQTSRRATFSEGEFKELVEGFRLAKLWASDPDEARVLERESAAAEVLGRALRAIDGSAWSTAVTQLERLEREFGDSLLFRLLTGGPQGEDALPPPVELALPERPTALSSEAQPAAAPVEPGEPPPPDDGR